MAVTRGKWQIPSIWRYPRGCRISGLGKANALTEWLGLSPADNHPKVSNSVGKIHVTGPNQVVMLLTWTPLQHGITPHWNSFPTAGCFGRTFQNNQQNYRLNSPTKPKEMWQQTSEVTTYHCTAHTSMLCPRLSDAKRRKFNHPALPHASSFANLMRTTLAINTCLEVLHLANHRIIEP